MISWRKLDKEPHTIQEQMGTSVFYNVIKEVPDRDDFLTQAQFFLTTDRLKKSSDTDDNLLIYVDGEIYDGEYTDLPGNKGGFKIPKSIITEDKQLYCEYLPNDPNLLFAENLTVISETKKILIEKRSITLTHNIIDVIIEKAKKLESEVFKSNEYAFSKFEIYNNRDDNSEISKMHISEIKNNIDEIITIIDRTNNTNNTIITYDPIKDQIDSDNKIYYNIIREELIVALRDQITKIDTNVSNITI